MLSDLFLTFNDLFDLYNEVQIDRLGDAALFDEDRGFVDFLDHAGVLIAVKGIDNAFFFDKSFCKLKHFFVLQFIIKYFIC